MTRTKTVHNLETNEIAVVSFTDEENAVQDAYERDVLTLEQMAVIRRQRNELLQETDYLALSDSTLTDEMRT